MTCTNCGTQNPAGQRFCDGCGSALAANCPSCGASNRPEARFCGSCGAGLTGAASGATVDKEVPVEPARQVAERRLVSVLFADLVGFTPFAEERDPELVRDTLSRYFETTRAIIERHGGTVEKFIGDAVMAVWGTPVAHEDDAERAVRAALELPAAVRTVAEGLQARAAVLTGEAAVSVGATEQGLLAGDLVNTAARLQAAAEPGTVLVGESTMRAAEGAIAFRPAGEQELKGKASPMPAWLALRVIAELGGRARADTLEPPFVGRDGQLAMLKDLLHSTGPEGRAKLVALTGPAGIGKSRLAWELEKYIDGLIEPIYWHSGRSPSYGEGISFWALGEMVRRRCELAEDDDEATTRQRVAATVAEYVHEDADRRWVEPALLALLGVEQAPAGGRDVLFAAWRIFFERIAERGTTVLLFEDLHFADSGLLDFIDHLLEWSRGSPMLIIALARPELLERRPTFGSAARHFHSVPLDPLTEGEMRQLLGGMVPDLDDAAARAIIQRADGIPLYAVETIRMLIADGRLEASDDGTCKMVGSIGNLAIPDTLRSLIAARLDGLELVDRTLLQQASVLGQSFRRDALVAVSGTADEDLGERLRGMVRREILAVEADPRSPERGQYRFVQGLIREVAYGTLSRRDRRERHLAAARHFEALGDEEAVGALATHYLAAHQASEAGPESDAVAAQARLALRGAAERAMALGAYEQAVGHLQQALTVTNDEAERADLLLRAAEAADADARYERAEELADQARAAFEAVGDVDGVGRASLVLVILYIEQARQAEAIELARAAAARLPEDAHELKAWLAARRSRAHMRQREDREAVDAADEALALAEPRDLVEVVAEALVNKGTSLHGLNRWREGAALLHGAVQLAEQIGANELHLRALNNLATVLNDDDPAAFVRIAEDALALSRRLGLRTMVYWMTGTVAIGRYFQGREWDEPLRAALEVAEESVNEFDRGRLLSLAFSYQAARGEASESTVETIRAFTQATNDVVLTAGFKILEGELHFSKGAFAAAYDSYSASNDMLSGDPTGAVEATRMAIWLGDIDRLKRAVARFDAIRSSGRTPAAIRAWGSAAVDAMEGRRAEALVGMRRALAIYRESEVDWEWARAVLDGLILMPDEPEMRAHAAEARAIMERLRTTPYLQRLDATLAAAQGVVRPQTTARAGEPVST